MTQPNIIQIDPRLLKPNPYQPPGRLDPGEEKNHKGADSVLRSGLIQIPVGRGKDGVYEIGDGWQRRCWYVWLLDHGHGEFVAMPVEMRELTDQQMADLIEETDENKSALNDIDRAWVWKKYLADFKSVTQAKLAKRRGVSQSEIANTIRLLELPEKVQAMIIAHEITPSHGRALLALKEKDLMIEYSLDAVKNSWPVATLEGVIHTYIDAHKPRLIKTPPKKEEAVFDKRRCRVCGCTESKACMTDGVACHWVEEDLCSACAVTKSETVTEEQSETITEAQSEELIEETVTKPTKPEDTVTKSKKVEKPAAPPAKKPETPKVVTPAAVKPKWKRKISIEEKDDGVLVFAGKVGAVPVPRKFPGTLEEAWGAIDAFIAEMTEQWAKEGKYRIQAYQHEGYRQAVLDMRGGK